MTSGGASPRSSASSPNGLPAQRSRRLRAWGEAVEGVLLLGLAALTWPVSGLWLKNWGATEAESSAAWPEDELLSSADRTVVRAITIDAPASATWPWILQLGLGKGGFHSYELLERLGGIPVTNVESLEPDLQHLNEGEEVLLHPGAPPLHVALVEPGRHVCFRTWRDEEDVARRAPDQLATWSLHLVPAAPDRCRLLLRTRLQERRAPTLAGRVQAGLEAPLDFVMEQRLLRTVKRLAEGQVGEHGGSDSEISS